MKIKIIGEAHIALRSETDEERILLKRFDKEGVRVSHTGSTLGICSPALAGLAPLYLNREEQTVLAYALGNLVSTDQLVSTDRSIALRAKELLGYLIPPVELESPIPHRAVLLKKAKQNEGVRIVCHTCDGSGEIGERKFASCEDISVICPECNGKGYVTAEAVEEAEG